MRCTAYCTAASYDLRALYEQLKDHFATTLYRETVHVAYTLEPGDVFFFSYGVLVCWGLTEEEELRLIEQVKQAESKPLDHVERDRYSFSYENFARIQRDDLILPSEDALTKLAVSFGLAQSVKLTVFEATIDRTIADSRRLPEDLARKGKIFLSRKQISCKIGELFIDKSSVNLHSDILDEPDFFWENPEYHPLYRDVFKCFDIDTRVEVLNTRLGILGDLLGILSDQLNHQYSSILEWTIIWLIVIEVTLALLRDLFHII